MTYLKKHEKPKNQVSGTDIELIFCRATQKKKPKEELECVAEFFVAAPRDSDPLNIPLNICSTFPYPCTTTLPILQNTTAENGRSSHYWPIHIKLSTKSSTNFTVLDILLGICFRSFM